MAFGDSLGESLGDLAPLLARERAVTRCFTVAAEQGHTEAQFRLGEWLARQGKGRFGDPDALGWLRSAAEQGHAEAQLRVGEWLYHSWEGSDEQGDEVLAEAVEWLRRAASRGHVGAQMKLAECCRQAGSCLVDEEAVRRNLATCREALSWLRHSARAGNTEAQVFLTDALLDGDFDDEALLETPLSPRQEGRMWLEQLAWRGGADDQFRLAELLDGYDPAGGVFVPAMRDRRRAEEWYAKAAEQGHVEAAQRLLAIRRAAGIPNLSDEIA